MVCPSLMQGCPATVPESVPPKKLVDFEGKLVMLGLGSIGMGTLPLLLKHIGMSPSQVVILTGDERADQAAEVEARYAGVKTVLGLLSESTFPQCFEESTGGMSEGDFLLNLSVDVSSCDLLAWCHDRGVNYVDTVVEPWAGGYTDTSLTPAQRTNYALREKAMALKRDFGAESPTAVITHGANPGMVTHFVKQGLLNIAAKQAGATTIDMPSSREEWARLAQSVGLRAVHIAERDTQVQGVPKEIGQFVNTWSIDGFIGEGLQPAELGWGTHEKELPPKGARHTHGCGSAIYIERPGASTRVRTWTPTEGPFHGWLITHNESISLSDYFTIPGPNGVGAGGADAEYRPTVHYAYHPCDDAVLSIHELAGKGWIEQTNKKLIVDEIISGIDELGVLLMGTSNDNGKHFAYWYGSQLEIEQSRRLIEYNSATSLQVTAAAMAATVWAMRNPRCGIREPEEVPHDEILGMMAPYIAPVIGEYTDWTPLQGRENLFKEDVDRDDPWQFRNVLVE
jgi:homospermidine synthase